MQAINDSGFQQHDITTTKRIYGSSETTVPVFKTAKRNNSFLLPEDIINLSMDRSATLEASAKKMPSLAVSSTEKSALRDSFSVYA